MTIQSRILLATAAICILLARVRGNPSFAQAQIAPPAKAARPLPPALQTDFYRTPHPLPSGRAGDLIRSAPVPQYRLPFGVSALRILYHSRTTIGEDVAVSGVVLMPDGKPPAGGWPVIAWAHEFRGVARACAPSLMKNSGSGPFLAMFAHLGYVLVATDYSGLGSDAGKAVVDMQSNALDVMYSVAAARAAAPAIGARWVALGSSQGALAAVAIAESEVGDPNFLGSVVTSGLADAPDSYQHFANGGSKRMLLVLASTVKVLYPAFQVSDMLADQALPAYRTVTQDCGGETGPEFTGAMVKPGWENNRLVKEFLARNVPGERAAHSPLLVISGEADSVTPVEMTERTVTRMCQRGDRVLFLKYPAVDASGVMGTSVADQISWIKARFEGDAAPGNCP